MMSEPIRDLPSGQSVVAEEYLPYYLSVISNRFSWGASSLYLRLFDVGMNEWRMLSALRNEPGITASRIVEMTAVNKSVASRSGRSLHTKGLAIETIETGQRLWWLTHAGVIMHDRIIELALLREEALMEGLSAGEKSQLFNLLTRLKSNLKQVEEVDALLKRQVE